MAVIFGRQPGAGKSAAVDAAMRDLEQSGGAVQIIGDDLRGYQPSNAPLSGYRGFANVARKIQNCDFHDCFLFVDL